LAKNEAKIKIKQPLLKREVKQCKQIFQLDQLLGGRSRASLIEYYVSEGIRIDVDVLIGSLLYDALRCESFDPSKIRDTLAIKYPTLYVILAKQKQIKRKGYHLYENRLKYNRNYYNQINSSPREVKLIKAADRLNNLKYLPFIDFRFSVLDTW
jgi:hypothetical protein